MILKQLQKKYNKLTNFELNQNKIVSISMVVSFMALIMAIPGSSNCASADSCTVASTGSFTGDLGIKSQTNYTLTQAHTFANNVTANWQDSGGNHVGTVIMKDNNGDFNLNGGLRLGTSATSTNGTLRWNGSAVQVYDSGWVGVGGSPTDDIGQVTSDSGSFTAASQQDNINIVGSGSISTAVVGDTLTISSSGGGTPLAVYGFVAAGYTPTGSGSEVIRLETEYYDTGSCFTFDGSPNYRVNYTCSDTKMFQEFIMVQVNTSSGNARMGMVSKVNGITLNEFMNGGSSVTQNSKAGFVSVCLNQNDYLTITVNSNGQPVEGGFGYSQFQLNEIQGVDVSGGCTDGKLD